MNINKLFIGLIVSLALVSCKNEDVTYPDFPYTTVYFASQYPVRTVELGEDLNVDNTLDNQHKVQIKATLGGTQDNNNNVVINFSVVDTLCNRLYYASGGTSGSKILPMPSSYYTLTPSNQITIPSGSILGGVEVQLTDAFFADPLSLTNTYVIPLLMTSVQGADSILQGSPIITNPDRFNDANWSIKPMDYILYTVKYVNPWHGNYLRRGLDKITKTDGTVTTSLRHATYVEQNDVVKLTTTSMKTVTLPLSIKNDAGTTVPFTLILTFADDGTCTVSGNDANFDISGSGKFVSKGEKNSFGGKDRDGLYLDYSVNFKNQNNLLYATKDTLVVRDRAVQAEYFTIVKR